jgi:hypothetical protein
MRLTFPTAVLAILASTLPAAAADGTGRVEIARSADFSRHPDPHPQTTGHGRAPSDAFIPPIEDGSESSPLIENGWDFSRPETIPGFGPWQIPQ